MAWPDRLLPASFRGIALEVDVDTISGGQRGTTHTYPGKDKYYREPMGNEPTAVSLSAYIAGDDYLDEIDSLVAALRDSRPGELIHPWDGSITVYVETWTVTRSSDELGQARVDMSFIPVGDLLYPAPEVAGADAVDLSADIVDAAASADAVQRTDVIGRASWVGERVQTRVGSLLDTVESYTTGPTRAAISDGVGFQTAIGDIADRLVALSSAPADQFEAVKALAVAVGDVGPLGRIIDAIDPPNNTVSESTPNGLAAEQSEEAASRMWRRVFISEAARATAALTFAAYDDAVAARERVSGWIDSELLADPLDPTAFDALADLRARVAADLTERAAKLPQIRTVEVPAEAPACVLAWRLYRDAERTGEIVDRNALEHPGFVSGSLRVLAA